MKPICSNTYRGFSLIEVLVTVVVLALALLALSKFQGDSLKEGSLSKQRTEATNIAQSQIEQFRNFTNFATVTTPSPNPITVTGTNATFTVNRTITAAGANLAQVQVTVTWPGSNGQVTPNTTITLASAISNVSPNATAQAAGTPAAPIVVPPPVTSTTGSTTTTTGATGGTDTTSTTSGTTGTTGTTSTTSTTSGTTGTTGTTSGTSGIPATASCTFYFTNPNTFTVTQSEPINSALCTTSCVSAKILYPSHKESYTVTCP